MTGADGTYDYKAMAAGIVLAGGEGMGNLLPVVEKELLHYRILDAMMREGFFSSLVFQGGTHLITAKKDFGQTVLIAWRGSPM